MGKTLMLGAEGQKVLKYLHVTCAALCLGGLLSILVLIALKGNIDANQNPFLVDLSIYKLFKVVVTNSFYGILLTAVVYALFTRWGFFKHHWITVKWLGVVVAFAFVWFWLGPAIDGMVSLADGGFSLPDAHDQYLSYASRSKIHILVVSFLLLLMFLISVVKPWGMRKRQLKVNRKVVLGVVLALAFLAVLSLAMQTITLRRIRNMEIRDSDLSSLADGAYLGRAKFGNFTYEAEVTVKDHRITDLEFTRNRKSSYARFAEGIIPKVIENQNANVDAITGATTTSKALMKAVENALTGRV